MEYYILTITTLISAAAIIYYKYYNFKNKMKQLDDQFDDL